VLRVGERARVEFETGEHAVDDGGVVDVEVRVVEPERVERFDRGEQAFRIRVEAFRADQFEAGRRELAHAAFLRILVAVGGRDVRQAQRQRRFAHPRRDQTRDGRRHFGAQGDLDPALIREQERLLSDRFAEPGFERVEAFEVRRLDLVVRPAFEDVAQHALDRALAAQFGRQPIARSGRQAHQSGASQTPERPKIDSSSFLT
jgi:hypothetical protein